LLSHRLKNTFVVLPILFTCPQECNIDFQQKNREKFSVFAKTYVIKHKIKHFLLRCTDFNGKKAPKKTDS